MQFILLNEREKEQYKNDIIEMMKESDQDFVPPLSSRNSTTQKCLKGGESTIEGLLSYYAQMNAQSILGAVLDGELLGFVSFKENYSSDVISEENFPNIYLSTLIVKKAARGQRLTVRLYEYLFNELFPDKNIFTRTWSTNAAHINILGKFGFSLIKTLKDDRGQGIDTVYFAKIRR